MEEKRLTLETKARGAVTVVQFVGDLDLGTLKAAKAMIQDELDKERSHFLLDLDQVAYIDSSGLGFLIGSLKKVREQEGDLKIARLNAYMMGIFKLLNLHEVLDVYETLDSAIASVSNAGVATE